MREDFAFCDLQTREIHIEEQHEGLFLLTLLIHEALHATFPRKLARADMTEKEEERWVERTAIEMAKLIKAADLAAPEVK